MTGTLAAYPVLPSKCKCTNQSANGAEYESQGQARSASPLGYQEHTVPGLKGLNTQPITPFQGWNNFDCFSRGDALRACPWLSYSAPLALRIVF